MSPSVKDYLSKHTVTQSQVIQDQKRYTWEMIKQDMPEIANFVLLINKAFGKPARVEYERFPK